MGARRGAGSAITESLRTLNERFSAVPPGVPKHPDRALNERFRTVASAAIHKHRDRRSEASTGAGAAAPQSHTTETSLGSQSPNTVRS